MDESTQHQSDWKVLKGHEVGKQLRRLESNLREVGIEVTHEIRKLIEDTFIELAALKSIARGKALRKDLMRTLKAVGLKLGQSLWSERLGLYAVVVQGKQRL